MKGNLEVVVNGIIVDYVKIYYEREGIVSCLHYVTNVENWKN